MGILARILGFDKDTISVLSTRLDALEERCSNVEILEERVTMLIDGIRGIVESLDEVMVEVKSLANSSQEVREKIEHLEEKITLIDEELEDLKEKIHEPVEDSSDDDVEEIVLNAIENGMTTPTEIIEATGLSKNKVYSVLRDLVNRGILEKRREGRHVHYSIIHSSENTIPKGEAVA